MSEAAVESFDLIVIGGGPAGTTAALRARELGAQVALVERGRMGGTCTNDGCVPTRVLARAARLLREAQDFALYGLEAAPPSVDFAQVMERVQQVVYQVHEKKQLLDHMRDMDISVFDGVGDAHFVDAHSVRLGDGRQLSAAKFILCVGGQARRLDFPGAELALTHSDVWSLRQLPDAVAIVGGGATGCQLASIFNAFGSRVMLLDIAPQLLLTEDQSVAALVAEQLAAHGIDLHLGIEGLARIEALEGGQQRLVWRADGREQSREVSAVILSVGWPGNLEGLHLEAAGVVSQKGYISVNDRLQSSVPHIYAAGDITGRMMLVQAASDQGRIAAENAVRAANAQALDERRIIPHGGFTDPEYAGVGLTEAQARQQHDCAVALVPYADMDRAVIDGHSVGFCKMIVDRNTRRLLGVHVVGEQAVEVVQIATVAMVSGTPVEELAEVEFAYPTFAAIIGLAARQLARELGLVQVARPWRELAPQRIAEWERRDLD